MTILDYVTGAAAWTCALGFWWCEESGATLLGLGFGVAAALAVRSAVRRWEGRR